MSNTLNIKEIKTLIVHGGQAHRDDFLATCLMLGYASLHEHDLFIERREPAGSDFDNPQVLILDVGMRWEPEKGNLDHHVDGKETSFSILNEVFGLGLEEEAWYHPSITLDNRGPFALGAELGVSPDSMKALMSPVEQAALNLFTQVHNLKSDDPLYQIMKEMGVALIRSAQMRKELYLKWDGLSELLEIKGARILVINEVSHPKMADFAKRFGEVDAIVSINFRTKTIELKRLNDSPKIDGRLISEECSFVHKTGFLAVLKTPSFEEGLKIIEGAIKEVDSE